MCDYCDDINLVKQFYTPSQYEHTIEYIQELIREKGFLFIKGNCELGKHKVNGKWIAGDIIWHVIKCPKCGQLFECTANTYRGGGSFTTKR